MKYSKYLFVLLLLSLSALVLLPASPLIQRTPPTDPGFFLYAGSRILKGDLLYRNVWDDKPPMIFMINAAGLWLANGSAWGVWFIQIACILAAVWLAFNLLEKAFGLLPAVLGISCGLTILLVTLHGGNYTEVYAIPIQIGSVALVIRALEKGSFWRAFVCGILWGLLFFLQQNLIGVGLAAVLFLILVSIFARSWNPIRILMVTALGVMSVAAVFVAIMAALGILGGFWDGVFVFGRVYSNLGLLERIKSMSITLNFFITFPLLLVTILIWLLALFLVIWNGAETLIRILRNKKTGWILVISGVLSLIAAFAGNLVSDSRNGFGLLQGSALALGLILILLAAVQLTGLLPRFGIPRLEKSTFHLSPGSSSVIKIATLWYPLELFMITLSGKSFLHYYMALCAICSLLYAFFAERFIGLLKHLQLKWAGILVTALWMGGIAISLTTNPINTMQVMFTPETNQNNTVWQAVQYIQEKTKPDDQILIWGSEPVVNFLANRSSPLRFTYISTIYVKGYGGKAISAEVLADIQTKKPPIILYTGSMPFLSINSKHQCSLPTEPLVDGLKKLFQAICADYQYVGNISKSDWKIYQLLPVSG